MEFWAVVGAANSRKSSTIRALTGAFSSGRVWDVNVHGRKADVYIETSAPQEQPQKTPAMIVANVNSTKAAHLLIALRHVGVKGMMHDADDYISYFVAAGWICRGILIASSEPPSAPLATKYPPLIDYAPNLSGPFAPSNAIADVVRSKWGL